MLNVAPALEHQIVAHYERAAKHMIFPGTAGTPFITTFLPQGFDGPPTRAGQLHHPVPAALHTVSVTTRSGTHAYLSLTDNTLLWRAHAYGIGFESWTPTPGDPLALGFARILVAPAGAASRAALIDAAQRLRRELQQRGCDAFALLDGPGFVLWIPFADAPTYPDVRKWLHDVLTACAFDAKAPLHISVQSNAPGLGTALPYSLKAAPEFPVVIPARWEELHTCEPIGVEESAAYFSSFEDVIAAELRRIGTLRFADQKKRAFPAAHEEMGPQYEYMPRAQVLTTAIRILGDGKPRTAAQILSEAIAQGLLAPTVVEKYVYVMLKAYIERTTARGRKPLILQDPDRTFRSNRPADDWPDPAPPQAPADQSALIDRLRAASSGNDPAAFEIAVCDAFSALGFAAAHIGGNDAPDGHIDAKLGVLGYRCMLECKTAEKPLQRPDIFEASKYREQYGARFAAIIGPAFGDTTVIIDECKTHGVCAWSVDDIARLLQAGADPYEMLPLFEPGVVADRMEDLLWNRAHGASKRVTVVCDAILAAGWAAQETAVVFDEPDQAPKLTEDAALLLVDERLQNAGAHEPCTRDEVREAFAYLTNPRVGAAVWTDAGKTAVVVRRGAAHA